MVIQSIQPIVLSPVVNTGEYFLSRIIDTETTSADPTTAEVIEVGWVDVWFPVHGGRPFMGQPFKTFVRPTGPITIEAMAVHHITEEEAATGIPQAELLPLVLRDSPDCFVAHNAKFEASLLDVGPIPWLCTYKSALRVYPDSPRHTNQVLRYQLGLKVDPEIAQPPHRAAPDAYVTAFLLMKMAESISLEQMIEWTREPAKFPRMNFGQHRGAKWEEVPFSYLKWILDKGKFDEDVIANVVWEMERRAKLRDVEDENSQVPRSNISETTCSPG